MSSWIYMILLTLDPFRSCNAGNNRSRHSEPINSPIVTPSSRIRGAFILRWFRRVGIPPSHRVGIRTGREKPTDILKAGTKGRLTARVKSTHRVQNCHFRYYSRRSRHGPGLQNLWMSSVPEIERYLAAVESKR